jgi:uncharacterized protein YkwD
MRAWLAATCGWGVVLCAWPLSGCGDAAGHPIRSITTPEAGLHSTDAGHDMLDAMSSATLPTPGTFPQNGPNQGPGSGDPMHDGRDNDIVPRTFYCAPAANWSGEYASDEQQMEQAINTLRDRRVSCANGVDEVQLPRLSFPPELRCSARLHSLDMYVSRYRGMRGSDNSLPSDRMEGAGFEHGAVAESIAPHDGGDADQILLDLLDNPRDCTNLASREFTAVGVGEYAGVWTFDFAAEP